MLQAVRTQLAVGPSESESPRLRKEEGFVGDETTQLPVDDHPF